MNTNEVQLEAHRRDPGASVAPTRVEANEPRRFLLVGCERSGSTMCRLMLDHHPELSCMYECDFMVTPYARYRNKPVAAFVSAIRDNWHFRHSGLVVPESAASYDDVIKAFFRQRMQFTGKRIVGATIQHGFEHLPVLFPDAQYVHLIRDGRPVAMSIVNMGWTGNTYYGGLSWRRTIEQVVTLQRRIDPTRWLRVRYEDLVRDPEDELTRVCRFLGVDYSEEMLTYPRDSTYDRPDPANADRWRTQMSPREILEAEMGAEPILEKLGYDPMFPRYSPSSIERISLRLGHRITRLRFNCRRYGTFLVVARGVCRLLGISNTTIHQRYQSIYDAHIR